MPANENLMISSNYSRPCNCNWAELANLVSRPHCGNATNTRRHFATMSPVDSL